MIDDELDTIGQRLVERYEYTPYGQRQVFSHGWLLEDLDGDGEIGSDADFGIVQNEQGTSNTASLADIDGNGDVDWDDEFPLHLKVGESVLQNDPLVTVS